MFYLPFSLHHYQRVVLIASYVPDRQPGLLIWANKILKQTSYEVLNAPRGRIEKGCLPEGHSLYAGPPLACKFLQIARAWVRQWHLRQWLWGTPSGSAFMGQDKAVGTLIRSKTALLSYEEAVRFMEGLKRFDCTRQRVKQRTEPRNTGRIAVLLSKLKICVVEPLVSKTLRNIVWRIKLFAFIWQFSV